MNAYDPRPLAGRLARDLVDPVTRASLDGLYGSGACDRELAARRPRTVIDLRGDDQRPRDPWDAAKQEASSRGKVFDPIEAAGISASLSIIGDSHDREARRREQVKRTESQRNRWVVALGACVTLRDGTTLSELERIDEKLIDHPHALEILQALVMRGIVSEIDAHTAWLRGLDPSVGPFVVVADSLQVGARTLKRGSGCSESDFPPLVLPRRFTDDEPLNSLTVGDLRRIITERVDQLIPPSVAVPPPRSAFDLACGGQQIVLAPNYRASVAKKASKS